MKLNVGELIKKVTSEKSGTRILVAIGTAGLCIIMLSSVFTGSSDDKKVLSLQLKYNGSERVISGIKPISKPGLRVYAQADELPKVLNGLGIAIISTSSGVMCDKKARKLGTGGEVLAYVW